MNKLLFLSITMISSYYIWDLPEWVGYAAFIPFLIVVSQWMHEDEEERTESIAEAVKNKLISD